MQIKRLVSTLLVALPVLAGCRTDEKLNAPATVDPMFQRYASLGNSITAGFQSGGISDSTQLRSYAQLLAKAMGTSFNYPQLAGRGCPPPFINNVTQARVGGGLSSTCDLRVTRPGPYNNVAVPGNVVANLFTNFGPPPSSFDPLKTIFLGGKTELEHIAMLRPTFITVWIGANDVLGALISSTNAGDTTQITSAAAFDSDYDSVATALTATGARVVLVNVPDVTIIPYASLGAIYYCAKNGGCPPPLPAQNPLLAAVPTFTVNANCSPLGVGLTTLVPWPVALTKLGAAQLGSPQTIDCTVAPEVISAAEVTAMKTAVASYNAHIAAVAAANGWGLVDVNATLQFQRDSVPGAILPFPDVSSLPAGPITFGTLFSLDGIHPSTAAHRLIADSVASKINQTYGTSLPVPLCATVSCPN